ncbi:hypothetical protein [Burkholderia plantarii]|uniref:hypothetical protein n=1 Tax=Burkholderia plantarii TaxID=41899 RepID=UPI00114CCBF2|nr:hypothetical protein [Burkholderia plantarii]
MCIRDSSEAEAQANHAARIVTQQFYGVAGHTPVSYTHLDVYKRQLRGRSPGQSRRPDRHAAVLRRSRAHACLLYTSRCV